jgi:hypothetical protein
MAKIIKKKLVFDAPEITDDVDSFNIYYALKDDGVNYDSPKLNIPFIDGQSSYEIEIDGVTMPISEGSYEIGVSSVDGYGNESDIEAVTYFFDLTPPPVPRNIRIL